MTSHEEDRDARRIFEYLEESATLLRHHHIAESRPFVGLTFPIKNIKQQQNLEITLDELQKDFETCEFQLDSGSYRIDLEVRKNKEAYDVYLRPPEYLNFLDSKKLLAKGWQKIKPLLENLQQTSHHR